LQQLMGVHPSTKHNIEVSAVDVEHVAAVAVSLFCGLHNHHILPVTTAAGGSKGLAVHRMWSSEVLMHATSPLLCTAVLLSQPLQPSPRATDLPLPVCALCTVQCPCSWFFNVNALRAAGGVGGNSRNGGRGGGALLNPFYNNWGITSYGGSAGGTGGDMSWDGVRLVAGGGGGASGLVGYGATGGGYPHNPQPGVAGGGGGGMYSADVTTPAGGGGGTGLVSITTAASGAPGSATGAAGGGGGSGGGDGGIGVGGTFGGGAGAHISYNTTLLALKGGDGGCRIMWGNNRAYPSTNTA
jgi:hypothetical protein